VKKTTSGTRSGHSTQKIQGAWIGDLKRPATGGQPCLMLRRQFSLRGKPLRATLRWSALGLADFFLNGQRVSDGCLLPGWSDYRKRVQVVTADVTQLLDSGANMLGAVLADGWYCGYQLWHGERNHFGEHPQLFAALDIDLQDGSHIRVKTDGTWEMRSSPTISADLYHGEIHDSRLDDPGWCLRKSPRKGWRKAMVFPDYPGHMDPKINEPPRVTEMLAPVTVTPTGPRRYLVDFGQNIAGVCRIWVREPKGRRITLRFAEMLESKDSLYTANLRTAKATDVYICRGGGEEWAPRFTMHGFRYVEISGVTKVPTANSLAALVIHSDMPPTGKFECSHPDLNRLQENIRWGLRGNFLDVPTDCPQRDERLGWTGDAQVFVGTAAFHYDVRRFFQKWMRDLRDGQRSDGAFPDVAPNLLTGFGNAAWADAGVICPWKIYWHYGDTEILRENYQAMKRWLAFVEATSRDLIRPPTSYGDWLAIDAVTPSRAPVPSEFVGTAYFAHTADLMQRIATVLGHSSDARRFATLRDRVRRAFQREFVTPGTRMVGHCQTAYLLALAFDLLPAAKRPVALAHLVDLLQSRNNHLTTGFIGTPLLCPVLSRFGHNDLAYTVLLKETYPSWLYSIRNGATTMWERWNSYTREDGFGPVNMNSFNHYAYGAIGEWMTSVIGGIRPIQPGFRQVLFAPRPGPGVTSASTTLKIAEGTLECHWQLESGRLKIAVHVPAGITARIEPPAGFSGKMPSRIPTGSSAWEFSAPAGHGSMK